MTTLEDDRRTPDAPDAPQSTVADRYLRGLKRRGIESLFVNAGTDFAPLIEAYASRPDADVAYPQPVVATHENLAAGMAHGAYLATGRPQAAMFHVSVGTANAVCAAINAARDNIPLLLTAGRTPILEHGATGARDTGIHWAQELFDQAGLVREAVKWEYELRDGAQTEVVVDRALSVATSAPRGPVYLSLPREVLAADCATPQAGGGSLGSSDPAPDPASVAEVVARIAGARLPVIVTSRSGADPATVDLLADLADTYAIAVAEPLARYVNLPDGHPSAVGGGAGVVDEADLVVVLDCDVPWLPDHVLPRPDAFIVHAGIDPLFTRYPIRSHRHDLAITTGVASLLRALASGLADRRTDIDPSRRERVREAGRRHRRKVAEVSATESTASGPITKAFMSVVLAEVARPDAVMVNEYWMQAPLLRRTRPGTFFGIPASGGLGWALPAALGHRYAKPEATVVCGVGDGAYMFANPAACHHAAARYGLPVLTIVANNSRWDAVDESTRLVYPTGAAVTSAWSSMSSLDPMPDLTSYATAAGGFGTVVHERHELRPALEAAFHAVEVEGRQAIVDVRCA